MSIPEAEVLHLLREMAEELRNIRYHLSELRSKTPWITYDLTQPVPIYPDVGERKGGVSLKEAE